MLCYASSSSWEALIGKKEEELPSTAFDMEATRDEEHSRICQNYSGCCEARFGQYGMVTLSAFLILVMEGSFFLNSVLV